jgi:hypothetical protein
VYDWIETFYDGLFIVQQGDWSPTTRPKFGIVDKAGRQVVPIIYDRIERIDQYDGLFARIMLDDKHGLMDKTGRVVASPTYDWIVVRGEFTAFTQGQPGQPATRWGLLDKNGNIAIPAISEISIGMRDEGATFRQDGKWGLVNRTGTIVIQPTYDREFWFSDGLAAVLRDDKWGFINSTGNVVIPLIYDDVGRAFFNGMATVRRGDKWGVINTSGTPVIQFLYDDIFLCEMGSGMIVAKQGGKWGIINRTGSQVIQFIYDDICEWIPQNNSWIVGLNGKVGSINATGTIELIPIEYDKLEREEDTNLILASKGGQYGFIDVTGRIIVPFDYYEEFESTGNMIFVYIDERQGILDSSGFIIIPTDYAYVERSGDVIIVYSRDEERAGLYDITGTRHLPAIYNDLVYAGNGIVFFNQSGQWGILQIDALAGTLTQTAGSHIVPSVNNPTAAHINLATQTITVPFTIGAFSIDNGAKWRTGTPDLAKILNRGMTLRVAEGFDRATKRPTGAVVWFPRIDGRPRGNPERLNLKSQRALNLTGANLAYEYATTAAGPWTAFTEPLPAPAARTTYFVRTSPASTAQTTAAPASYTPSGRVFKVNVRP